MRLLNITTGECLNNIAQQRQNEIAVSECSGRALSWKGLEEQVDAVAKGFLKAGLSKDEKLVIWSTNSVEWVVCYLAAAKIGIVTVLANIHLKKSELISLLHQTDAVALCFCDGHRNCDFSQIVNEIQEEFQTSKSTSSLAASFKLFVNLKTNKPPFSLSLNNLQELGKGVDEIAYKKAVEQVKPEDVVSILMTSGSTAKPKAVMLTHHNVINNAYYSAHHLGVTEDDKICLAVPLFHCFGLSSGLYFALSVGCTITLVETYSAEDVLRCINRHCTTVLHGVPTMFSRLIEHPNLRHYDLNSLKKGILAGAYCTSALIEQIYTQLGMDEIVVSYGQTETSPCCTQTSPHDTLQNKCTTIGKPIPFVEMRVVNPETGKPCAVGVVGELRTRGTHVMKGYYKAQQQTKATFDEEGWLRTGDAGFVDEGGVYHYLYRLKDIINRGGEKISPLEVEMALIAYDFIEQVKVFGIEDSDLGEVVAAAVVLKKGCNINEKELRHLLKPKMTHYKVPKHIEFKNAFPYTPSGKVDVQALKRSMLEKLGKTVRDVHGEHLSKQH